MTKSADAIDNLLLAILTSSLVVPTIVQSYGLDIRLFWMPAICYAIWIGYVGYLKPKVTFSDSLERSTVERIRGWSYVLSLPVTLIANFLLSEVLPKTLTTYIMGTAAVGIVLSAVVVTFPRRLFRKEIIYMNKNQEMLIYRMLKESGTSSIWASVSILSANSSLASEGSYSLEGAALISIIALLMLLYSFYRNRKSSKIAHEIAISLINSRWRERFVKKQRRK